MQRHDEPGVLLPTWRLLLFVYGLAVVVNYPWELFQSPLFTPASHPGSVWVHCFVSSLGDGGIVLLLFVMMRLALGRRDWYLHPGWAGYALLAIVGAGVAVLIEAIAVYMLQRWVYTDAMPRLPVVNVGAVPVLQMVVLPP